jgi:hypothetical protein
VTRRRQIGGRSVGFGGDLVELSLEIEEFLSLIGVPFLKLDQRFCDLDEVVV